MKFSRNDRVLVLGAAFIGIMVGLTYASVPLYSLFCRTTGFGGTVRQSSLVPQETKDRYVTVLFDSNVDPALPWDFAPDQKSVKVRLGLPVLITYHAHNRGDKITTGTATFNVQPDKAGAYFDKVQCFCFSKQTIKPGQTVELPVQFYIDPEMVKDRENDDVQNITLSYTFFLAKTEGKNKN